MTGFDASRMLADLNEWSMLALCLWLLWWKLKDTVNFHVHIFNDFYQFIELLYTVVICNMLKTHIQALVYGRAAPCRRGVPEIIRCPDWSQCPPPPPDLHRSWWEHISQSCLFTRNVNTSPVNVLCQKNRNVCFKNFGALRPGIMRYYLVIIHWTDPQGWRTRRPTWSGLSAALWRTPGSGSCCGACQGGTSLKYWCMKNTFFGII